MKYFIVYEFDGEGYSHPMGLFSTLEKAEDFIKSTMKEWGSTEFLIKLQEMDTGSYLPNKADVIYWGEE